MLLITLLINLALASPARPTPTEVRALLDLDYEAFDQNLPAGGWRGIVDQAEAGRILDAYVVRNGSRLNARQRRTILWHAGQTYATAGRTDVALKRFRESFEPDEPDEVRWNAYVRATIAFLEGDLAELKRNRDELVAAHRRRPNANAAIVDGLVRCFGKPYREAYGGCGK